MPGLELQGTLQLTPRHRAALLPESADLRSATPRSGGFIRLGLLALALSVSLGGQAAESTRKEPAKWVTLERCRFMSEEQSDGDSFHVKSGQREFIFRLYFVDAPETDQNLKDRVNEQSR